MSQNMQLAVSLHVCPNHPAGQVDSSPSTTPDVGLVPRPEQFPATRGLSQPAWCLEAILPTVSVSGIVSCTGTDIRVCPSSENKLKLVVAEIMCRC